jgi:NAD+ kinase
MATARMADLSIATQPDIASVARESDLLVVFGGDGTMLSVARSVAGLQTPIFGVNVGGLGFLTAVAGSGLTEALEQIWNGEFALEERNLIEAEGSASGQRILQAALNDFVVRGGSASRLIELEVMVNQMSLTNYRCDGLIVCSPTGSTAYSLAAGGAIVAPDAPVMTITPICPHTLSNRSVIVGMDSVVEVKVLSQKLEVFLTADGQVQLPLLTGDSIRVRKSKKSIYLVRLPENSFFTTLRQKLHWRGSNVN